MVGGDDHVPTGPAQYTFQDVPPSHWAYDYIEYCGAAGIVQGYTDNEYRPDLSVDRAQMAVFIARAIAEPTVAVSRPWSRPESTPDSGCPLGLKSLTGLRRRAGKRTPQRESGAQRRRTLASNDSGAGLTTQAWKPFMPVPRAVNRDSWLHWVRCWRGCPSSHCSPDLPDLTTQGSLSLKDPTPTRLNRTSPAEG